MVLAPGTAGRTISLFDHSLGAWMESARRVGESAWGITSFALANTVNFAEICHIPVAPG
jgi:hypothetical protein